MFQCLLEAHADVSAGIQVCLTALHLSAAEGHFEVVRLLLHAFANQNVPGAVGQHAGNGRERLFAFGSIVQDRADQNAVSPDC